MSGGMSGGRGGGRVSVHRTGIGGRVDASG